MTEAIDAAQSKMNTKTEISEQKVHGLLGIIHSIWSKLPMILFERSLFKLS